VPWQHTLVARRDPGCALSPPQQGGSGQVEMGARVRVIDRGRELATPPGQLTRGHQALAKDLGRSLRLRNLHGISKEATCTLRRLCLRVLYQLH
jgi:hypothetical protein